MGVLSGGFLQGNPVYDYDDHDYIGAYVQDDWRIRPNVTVNAGALGAVHSAAQYLQLASVLRSRADAASRARSIRRRPPGCCSWATRGIRAAARPTARWRSLRRVWARSGRRAATATPASAPAGRVLRHAAPVLQHPFANNPPWGAQITLSNPAGAGPIPTRPIRRQSFPALNTGWETQPFPAFGVYVNAPMDINPTRCSSGTSARSVSSATMPSTTYLGNKSTHLWRATELNPAVFGPARTHGQHQPAPPVDPAGSAGQFYGTIDSR